MIYQSLHVPVLNVTTWDRRGEISVAPGFNPGIKSNVILSAPGRMLLGMLMSIRRATCTLLWSAVAIGHCA